MAALHVPIQWAQRKDRIFLTIALRDIKDEKINLTEKELTFSGLSDSKIYEQTINFFSDVDTEESKWNKTDFHLQFILIKKDKSASYWKRLIAEEKKYQNIQLDWSKYVDEDDEAEEGGKGVGGGDWDPEMMNKFGGGGEGPQDDSDDDDLPAPQDDLEKEEELPAGQEVPAGQEEEKEEKKCEDNCGHEH